MIRFSQHSSSNMCSVVVAPVLMLFRNAMEVTSPPAHLAVPPRTRRSACSQAHRPLIHDMYRALLDDKQ